jgi:hypothetical protein
MTATNDTASTGINDADEVIAKALDAGLTVKIDTKTDTVQVRVSVPVPSAFDGNALGLTYRSESLLVVWYISKGQRSRARRIMSEWQTLGKTAKRLSMRTILARVEGMRSDAARLARRAEEREQAEAAAKAIEVEDVEYRVYVGVLRDEAKEMRSVATVREALANHARLGHTAERLEDGTIHVGYSWFVPQRPAVEAPRDTEAEIVHTVRNSRHLGMILARAREDGKPLDFGRFVTYHAYRMTERDIESVDWAEVRAALLADPEHTFADQYRQEILDADGRPSYMRPTLIDGEQARRITEHHRTTSVEHQPGGVIEVTSAPTNVVGERTVLLTPVAEEAAPVEEEWCSGCNTDHAPAECGYRPVAEEIAESLSDNMSLCLREAYGREGNWTPGKDGTRWALVSRGLVERVWVPKACGNDVEWVNPTDESEASRTHYLRGWRLTDMGRAVARGAVNAPESASQMTARAVEPSHTLECQEGDLEAGERAATERAERLVPKGTGSLALRQVSAGRDESVIVERDYVVGVVASELRGGARYTGNDVELVLRGREMTLVVTLAA